MIGQQLGSYRVIREIGRGGMGAVWLGEHVELKHQVAIKVLLPQVALDSDLVQRFFNEARAAASVKHPGIVQVLDFGRAPDGSAYLAMELLEGQTLRARLRVQGAMDPEEAATIVRQVATTLGAAHEAGVVHRDLKPDNIMLVPDPEVAGGERPKVLDFGIAKLAEDRWEASVATRTGSLLGTPHYMSPEQCRGTGVIDARADVYALGCILFELVCGRPPFVSQGLGEIVGMHQFVPAPSPRGVRPDLPEWLDAVILRALAKDPDRRFAGMDELARALEGGGVPAARLARASEPPTTEHAVALAETIATPGAQAIAAAEVVESPGADVEAMTADAQHRALELAEALARQHRDSGTLGRRIAVVAVAVVVLGAVLLYAQSGGKAARDDDAKVAQRDRGTDDEPKGGFVGGKTDDHFKSQGGGTSGSGSSAGSGSGSATMRPVDPPRDAGVPARPPRDARDDDRQVRRDAGVPVVVVDVPIDAGAPPDASTDPNDDPEVKRYLALLERSSERYAQGDYDGALKVLREAYAIFPDDVQVLQMLVIQSCHAEDGDAARRYYRKIEDVARRSWLFDECKKDGVVVPEP